jgi:hypothetical protein
VFKNKGDKENTMKLRSEFLALLAATFALTLRGIAQVPSLHESTVYQANTTSGSQSDSSSRIWHEVIKNEGSTPLVALHATFHCPAGGGFQRIDIEYLHDPLIRYGYDTEIPPGGSLEISAADPAKCPGGVDAAIFEDHYEGDLQQVNRLYARRRGTYRALADSLDLLSTIVAQSKSPQDVINSLAQLSQSVEKDQTIDSFERKAIIDFYSYLKSTLQSAQGVVRAPSDHTAHRQPTYRKLSDTDSISIEQAQATVISNKFREWRADLEENMNPPQAK